ncbi:MAG: hypothetical protein H7125_01240 [Proteobacteria bacterium]|nr:hypothetical protein [Burkholderiales bacterium]
MKPYRILIMGASYGSLLGTKLALAGHSVNLVCLPAEVEAINRDGARLRMPIRGREALVEIDSRNAPGRLTAAAPDLVRPIDYDLVVLAMQEPQYRSSGVRELLARVGEARVPCMSIMNMPPLTYLKRIPGLDAQAYRDAYADPTVWDGLDAKLMTLCSPDAQAFRPPDAPVNVLQVRLPTNFKAARFESDEHTAMLHELADSVEKIRFDTGSGEPIDLPVKLKVHESVFVPLAKWSMLVAGNYRCITKDGMRPIKEAVHSDPAAARAVYEWVADVCMTLGADPGEMVPFEKYAQAAEGLVTPSSAARALFGGARDIERVDRLVQDIALMQGKRSPELDEIVTLIDARLVANRRAQP